MSEIVIEMDDLIVRAGHRTLLQIEHLRIPAGTVAGLVGPNGAGKTTFLRACLGLAASARGDIKIFGEPVSTRRGDALLSLRRRMGYVPQLLPIRSELPLTVREVIAIGRTARAGLFHRLSREDWKMVDTWMDRLGLSALAESAYGEISGGEQRKTVIARAMVQEPELLLLDEPTVNLDLGWRECIVELIQGLYLKARLSVVLVCHELEVLPPACRQVILLEDGRISASGEPETIFTSQRVSALYGVNLHAVHRGGRHGVLPGEAYD